LALALLRENRRSGVDNLLVLTLSEGKGVTSVGPILLLSSHLSARDLAPNLEWLCQLVEQP
jgi:hypothetical protein